MLTWLFRLTMLAIVAGLIGLALLWEPRLNDDDVQGGCTEASATRGDDGRIEFDAGCDLWPREVAVSASVPIQTFSPELETQKDVGLFGGGGPDCARAPPERTPVQVVCEGEVDAGETFSGWVRTASGPCSASISLQVSGGKCSEHASSCDDAPLAGQVLLPRPSGC